MFSTRHFVLGVAMICSVVVFAFLWLLPSGGEGEQMSQGIFIKGGDTYEVVSTPHVSAPLEGDSFRARVREYVNALPRIDHVPEVPIEEDATPFTASVPKSGSVYACEGVHAAYVYDVPQIPRIGDMPQCVPTGTPIGIFNSGAFLYSGVTEVLHEADACGRSVGTDGVSHHHTESPCVSASADGSIGYAFDGFPIYPSSEEGKKITNEDLDVCHGHTHSISVNGVMVNQYHYHMTDEYPYSIGCFKGVPTPQ